MLGCGGLAGSPVWSENAAPPQHSPVRNICPAQRLDDRRRRSARRVETVVSGIGVGLQDAGEAAQMLDRMIARAVPGVMEQRRRWVRTAERAVVADIDPGPAGGGPALREHRYGGVVAMQARRCQDMGRDQVVQRLQRRGAGADLVGQRGQAEIDPFAGVAVALPVQRLMLAVLLEQDHGQQVRARPAPRQGMERCRGLGDLLAIPAGELLAHRLDHLPATRDDLQGLGDILADSGQPGRSAALAGLGRRHDHALAWQIGREGPARRLAAHRRLDLRAPGGGLLRRQLVLGSVRGEFVEFEFELVEQARLALRAPAVQRAPELFDQEGERYDPRLGIVHLCLGRCRPRLGIGKGHPEGLDIGRGAAGHGRQESHLRPPRHPRSGRLSHRGTGQPARDGRQVRTGLRQSMPSSM